MVEVEQCVKFVYAKQPHIFLPHRNLAKLHHLSSGVEG